MNIRPNVANYFAIRNDQGNLVWDGERLEGRQLELLESRAYSLDVERWTETAEGPVRTGFIANACAGCLHSIRQDHGDPRSSCACCRRPFAG